LESNKLIPSQVHERRSLQTRQNHCVTTKAQKDMAIVKQVEKQVKYRQQIYAYEQHQHFFFVKLSDKHRLLGQCIKYIHLLKDV
jgi:hypothetical protein